MRQSKLLKDLKEIFQVFILVWLKDRTPQTQLEHPNNCQKIFCLVQISAVKCLRRPEFAMDSKPCRCIMLSTCFWVFWARVIVNFLGYQGHIKAHRRWHFNVKLRFWCIFRNLKLEREVSHTSAISPLLTYHPTGLKKYILSSLSWITTRKK